MPATGTVVHTATPLGKGVIKHTVAWTSDGSGNVNTNPFAAGPGWLLFFKFVPSTVAAPTALYDVVVNDTNGLDVSRGAGANLSATVPSITAAPAVAFHAGGNLDVAISNAGSATQGTVVFCIGTNPNS